MSTIGRQRNQSVRQLLAAEHDLHTILYEVEHGSFEIAEFTLNTLLLRLRELKTTGFYAD